MPEVGTQTEFPKANDSKVKEILEIIAKILEIQTYMDKGYWDFLDETFSEEMSKLYWHYKDELYNEVKEIYKFRKGK